MATSSGGMGGVEKDYAKLTIEDENKVVLSLKILQMKEIILIFAGALWEGSLLTGQLILWQ